MKGYPRGFLAALIATMLVLAVSGALLAPTTLVLRADLPLAWRLPAPMHLACAALHAGAGLAMLLLAGALWSVHMRAHWRHGKQRRSGLVLGTMLLLLALSAVAIYYAGEEGLGTAAALLHLAFGAALIVTFGWHGLHGWRSARTAVTGLIPAAAHRRGTGRAFGHAAAKGPGTARPSSPARCARLR